MKHRCTRDVIDDLRRGGRLIEIDQEVDPNLEAAEIQRRVYASGGPALWFKNLKGCHFTAASNLFASLDQACYLFRDTLDSVRRVIEVKIDPGTLARKPWRYAGVPLTAIRMLPRTVRSGPVQQCQGGVADLPMIKCWPEDGGPFVTLPQVISGNPQAPRDLMQMNLGMYRVQLSGNDYVTGQEVGLHYQIHRGIGVHHRSAMDRNERLRVAVSVGGSPAMSLAAVMPLPEGLSELTFAGALAGRRIGMVQGDHAPVYADADFAIVGSIGVQDVKPEGPFGDHLGYYSLKHDFPVMKVERVWHRKDAIWPFTVVGRPPQEDTTFGQLIHELTSPIIPTVIPGVKAVHAVDDTGVHPLLVAIGSERYMPHMKNREPQELLTQANAILGNGQLSLAKYLWMTDDPKDQLDVHNLPAFFSHMLCRVDWRRDVHFYTRTTIDTLDYSGTGLNQGSKVVIATTGKPIRTLPTELPTNLSLPRGVTNPRIVAPGILVIEAPPCRSDRDRNDLRRFAESFEEGAPINAFPLVTLCDDSEFAARNLSNWLWVTFTRSNPAIDIDGVEAFTEQKHWGCRGSLIIDARSKPHHAPLLMEDPQVTKKIDAMAANGGPLSRYL